MTLLPVQWVYAQCNQQDEISVRISADEFEIPGYDAKRELLAIRLPNALKSQPRHLNGLVLQFKQQDIHFQVAPSVLGVGLESGIKMLDLVITGHPTPHPEASGPTSPCKAVVATHVSLHKDGLEVAQTRLDAQPTHPSARMPKLRTMVKVETGQVNRDESARRFEKAARRCLKMTGYGRIHGALGIQVETSLIGEPQPPRAVVDGIVNRPFTRCLIRELTNDETLWANIEPATRAYLTVYISRAHHPTKESKTTD